MSGSFSGKHDYLKGDSREGQPSELNAASSTRHGGSRLVALQVEFVAKPSEAHMVHTALPTAIYGAMEGVAGFAGAFVMVSRYEARLVTVVTLWAGEDRARRCDENVRWVRALLAPYMDRCLRVQTLATYLPPDHAALQETQTCSVLEGVAMTEESEAAALVV